jgi:2-polyprenyl-3-methyl-5-hydroxy-6-metoxy-1,4-benzoquinol methylase
MRPPRDYERGLREYYRVYYEETLGLDNVPDRIEKRVQHARGKRFYKLICRYVKDTARLKVLDVGCGTGELLAQFDRDRNDLYGVEPDQTACKLARMLVPGSRIESVAGESLPFSDEYFDIVTSFHVLEHVESPERVISEMLRVLRPDGSLFVECPNYLYPQEGHYEIAWIPCLPKPLASRYLRMIGRSSQFIEHIQYVHPYRLERAFRKNDAEAIELVRINLTNSLAARGALKRTLLRLALAAKVYTPLQYYIRKKQP